MRAARDLNCACTVVVPTSAKPFMIAKLHAAGAADVIQHGASWFEADSFLRAQYIDPGPGSGPEAQETVNVYIPPFDNLRVWEGASSMIDEIAAQMPAGGDAGTGFPAEAIVCSVGGGGLFNGVVMGLEKHAGASSSSKDVRVLAVETEGAHSLAHSLRLGRLDSLSAITSQATSLGALCVAEKAFLNARSPPAGVQVSSIVSSDAEAARGIVLLADETRLQVELACGVSVEVAVGGRLKEVVPDLNPESRVVVVVCGGSNITAEMIAEYRRQLDDGWK